MDRPFALPTPFRAGAFNESIRCQLFAAVLETFNAAGTGCCLLGGDEGDCDFADSDVDFAFRSEDRERIPHLLAAAAHHAGSHLVQAIAHETTGCYYVIAKRAGTTIGFLNPDCTTDYRRQRRLWLRADELLDSLRTTCGSFRSPAADREFLYYLIKKVLKQSVNEAQWQKLTRLHHSNLYGMRMLGLWPSDTAATLETALAQNDDTWFRAHLPQLLRELKASPSREGRMGRARQLAAEFSRIARRVVQPTGLFVRILGGSPEQRTELAHELVRTMAPAFRATHVLGRMLSGGWDTLADMSAADLSAAGKMTFSSEGAFHQMCALIRSTLVVATDESIPFRRMFGGLDVSCDNGLSTAENQQRACALIIAHMARRTARRLRLSSEHGKLATATSLHVADNPSH